MKFAAILLLAATASATVEHYHDHSVYRLRPRNATQLKLLQNLEEQDVDFWREADQVNRIADVMLTPANKDKILKYFADNQIPYELLVADVEQRVEQERKEQNATKLLEGRWPTWGPEGEAISGFWSRYQRFDQHGALVDALASKNPSLVQKVTFGRSFQGRSLIAARVGVNSNSQKPVVWIQGGIHAREWISPATVTYFLQQLVNKYTAGDAEVTELLTYFDIYIVPVLNADGYEYTHSTSRMWRKTRQPSRSWMGCIGADPNRNYGHMWGGEGASSNPCTETFRGQSAFSEPETKSESDYILQNFAGRLKAFVAVHSYGQYFLYPWGYSRQLTPDNAELNRVARLALAAWQQVTPSQRFTIGTATNVLYAAAGGADDWAYGQAKARYAYTIELPDTGTYGFQLPASQIVPVGKSFTNALLALTKAVKARG